MNNQSLQLFFDNKATNWQTVPRNDQESIKEIFDLLKIEENQRILDVGCGTGILFEPYLKTKPSEVVGIDISCKMIEISKKNYQDNMFLKIFNVDVYEFNDHPFDLIMMYNCYPHLLEKDLLVEKIKELSHNKTRVIIAHGYGKETINSIHHDHNQHISQELKSAQEEAVCWKKYYEVKQLIDRDDLYLIELIKQ